LNVDLFRLPAAGAVLRWRHLRLLLQVSVLALATLVVVHGLFGPQIAPRNLATVLTSIHWRGLLIVSIVVVGNLFCAACPMILVRDVGRRLIAPRRSWPRALRLKWVGLAGLVAVLFSYELFDLWAQPAATVWIVIGYFAAALAVDLVFKGASFCKYVCPIGQFNFVASTLAPTELRARDTAVCRGCRTSDCIKGHTAVAPLPIVRRGCELGLFMPAKVGNLDCTLCFDCVRACPHDNIALVTRTPGLEMLDLRRRSGVGRLFRRIDIATLAVIFTFASLVNAFAMTTPAYEMQRRIAAALGTSSEAIVLGILFAIALVLLPATLLASAAAATRYVSARSAGSARAIAIRYAYALVPVGLGVWVAHYGFHLLTGILTIVPVAQSAWIDLTGSAVMGEPAWWLTGMSPGAVFAMQLGVVVLGAFGSTGLVLAISDRDLPDRAVAASIPWLAVVLVVAAAALWILQQPMEMRGLGLG
jgi:ferredoxin